jgi:hypothetical protein
MQDPVVWVQRAIAGALLPASPFERKQRPPARKRELMHAPVSGARRGPLAAAAGAVPARLASRVAG